MSEQTKHALEQANEAVARAEANVTLSKRQALSAIADKIPEAIDQRAKEIAQANPDVTRNLGKEGINNFRSDLAERAAALAAHMRNGEDNIKWPDVELLESSRFWGAETRKIHNAVCDSMKGSPIDEVKEVFAQYGYKPKTYSFLPSDPLLNPYFLCAMEDLEIVSQALEQLADARTAQLKAKAEDDEAVVNDLWT